MTSKTTALAVAALLAAAGPALAHHSFAAFDGKKEVTLSGVVKDFQWTNPHAVLDLAVEADGKTTDYKVEGLSPNWLARQGWSRNSLKPGDRVTVVMHPLKDGTPGGSFVRATFADGRKLG